MAGSWEEELFAFFDDLESQADAAFGIEREAELADRRQAEYGVVTLASRLMASIGRDVTLTVDGVGAVPGELVRVSEAWSLLGPPHSSGSVNGGEWVIPHAAVWAATGLSERSVAELAWSPVARLGLGSALRRMASERQRAVVHLRDGQRFDSVPMRIGKDFVELHVGEGAAASVTAVSFAAIAAIRRWE